MEEIINEINKYTKATLLDNYNGCYYFLVKDKKKLLKKIDFRSKEKYIKLIESNNGFLDPKWEKDILNKKQISEEERIYIEIYDTYSHSNIFKYCNKEHINLLISDGKFHTTVDLIEMLEKYMKQNGYNYYYCTIKNINMNYKLIKEYHFLSKIDKIIMKFNFIMSKMPGFISKITFFFKKKINQILKVNKIKKIEFIQKNKYTLNEVIKNEIKFGCIYYIIQDKNEKIAFFKGFDYFKVAKNEIIANKKMNTKFNLNLLDTDNENYTIFEYIKTPTLDEYIKYNKELTKEDKKIIINKLYEILENLYKNEIIHRDIREENILLIVENDKIVDLKLIDYGYCVFQKKDYLNYRNIFCKKVLKSLGDLYKPDLFYWDDAIETLNLLENIDNNIYRDFKPEIEKIEKIKGRYTLYNGGENDKNCFFNFAL